MRRRNIIVAILSITLTIIVLIGSSYAYLRQARKGSDQNITIANFGLVISKDMDAITLNNEVPKKDEEGLKNSSSTFTIKNEGDIEAKFKLSLIDDELLKSTMSNNNIRYKLKRTRSTTKEEEEFEIRTLRSDGIIDEGTIDREEEISYEIIIWIDYDANPNGLTFKKVLSLEGSQIDIENTIYTKMMRAIEEHPGTTIEEDGVTYLSGSNDDINYNYVWYSGKLWRITSINSDGTIKMITNDVITAIHFSDTNYFERSYAYQFLNEDFKDTLYNNKNIIEENTKWNVTTQEDFTNKIPETKTISGAVGLLNAYEYYQSYKKITEKDGYLNTNLYRWFLFTTYNTEGGIYRIDENGGLLKSGINNSGGIRPSIVLKTNVELLNGDGSVSNPYLIKGDNNFNFKNEKLNTRLSGEYVKFDNSVYQIVDIQNESGKTITKLVKNDDLGSTKAITKESEYYGDSANIKGDYWDYYLNNDWYNSISTEYRNMMVKSTYYLGKFNRNSYKTTICSSEDLDSPIKNCKKVSKTWTGYVGLLRIGELFAINNNTHNNTEYIWSISPESSKKVFGISVIGTLDPFYVTGLFRARPVITLSSDVIITSGDGMTPSTAYEISLP